MRGRCEGFPSVWNEVSYSPWDAAKRDDIQRSGGGDEFKEATGETTQLFLSYIPIARLHWQQCDFCLSFSFLRTLNNNNISSIPVSSFNHMPKLRTL